jgi:enoyl-CoA hydratase/carnithine racemase
VAFGFGTHFCLGSSLARLELRVLFEELLARVSSEWLSAEECERIGLAWRVAEPGALLLVTLEVAQRLAAKPIASLVETKAAIISAHRDLIAAARRREDLAFSRLLGQPANLEALAALSERRCPDFAAVDAANPPDLERHRAG